MLSVSYIGKDCKPEIKICLKMILVFSFNENERNRGLVV